VGTLWRALFEGFGWHVGKEVAKDALATVEKALDEADVAAPDPKALAVARKASAKAAARAAKERKAEKKRADREIDAELRKLKKRVARWSPRA
jgi:hypothetical protein